MPILPIITGAQAILTESAGDHFSKIIIDGFVKSRISPPLVGGD